MTICEVVDCGRPHYGRGMCKNHYARWKRRADDPEVGSRPHGPRPRPLASRFWAKVRMADGDACWEWGGALQRNGYGSLGGEMAHRVAWMVQRGPIPEGSFVLHHCDRRSCVRGDHLFLGSHRDNMADMVSKGRSQRGSRNRSAKLTPSAVRAIRRLEGVMSQREIAEWFGVHVMTVNHVLRGRLWKHVA